ncbi:hypothetical protein AtEden1_Chr5g0082881 [Arabidopsis thaliana]
MAQSSTEPKFSLRLIIDEEKNKVVLAEAGTIVRLLAKHRKSDPVTIGCLRNLYTSVVDMELDDFETDACKQMLLYPKNIREAQYRNFKLNID